MTDGTEISITTAEVRTAMEVLCDSLERELGSSINLAADHYWHVGADEAFDLSTTPAVLVGQLDDDVQSVRSMIDSADPVLWHDLDHLIGVLRRLAALARL